MPSTTRKTNPARNMKKTSTSGKVDKKDATERVRKILPLLEKAYPEAKTALRFKSPLELLIATILSAQCTDVRVNMVTPKLFNKYRSAADWAKAPQKTIESDIRSTGFYRNKARNIEAACNRITEGFGGKIPNNIDELVTLPGVGRKTANVILGNAFGKPAITCDTHVIRLSRRLAFSTNASSAKADKLEFDLAEIIPKAKWTISSHLLILHGRNVCKARKPNCSNCCIAKHCPSANKPGLW